MLKIDFIETDIAISDFENRIWKKANSVAINKSWSGERAPVERHTAARLLWSGEFFYVRFDGVQMEPLVTSVRPDVSKKAPRLWEHDVCEIFIAPGPSEPTRYFEFEVAPNGEWLDLGIRFINERRETDWEYNSKMETSAKNENDRIVLGIKIPWSAFDKKPTPDEIWLGNLFRIVGKGESRGYFAWQPTLTEKPNFHVPEKFGEFRFVR